MKRLVMAVALACVLSGTSLAGIIPTSDYAPPPPSEDTQTASYGEIPSTDYAPPPAENPLAAVLLTILSVL